MPLLQDAAYLGPMQSLTCLKQQDKCACMLALIHDDMPCRAGVVPGDKAAVNVSVLRVNGAGFMKAPYQASNGKAKVAKAGGGVDDGKPLFRLVPRTDAAGKDLKGVAPDLQVWSYVSKGQNRGPRVCGPQLQNAEDGGDTESPMYVLRSGVTFTYFINSLVFQDANTSRFPANTDWIPAMSLVEITFSPGHEDRCLNGWGINVRSVHPAPLQPYALFPEPLLKPPSDAGGDPVPIGDIYTSLALPESVEEGITMNMAARDDFAALTNVVSDNATTFLLRGSKLTKAFIGDCDGVSAIDVAAQSGDGDGDGAAPVQRAYAKFVVGDCEVAKDMDPEFPYVLIAVDDLLRATNTDNIEHAINLVSIACGMGAMDLLVSTTKFWKKKGYLYKGVPILDTRRFFSVLSTVTKIDGDCLVMGDDDDAVEVLRDGPAGLFSLDTGKVVVDDDEDIALKVVLSVSDKLDRKQGGTEPRNTCLPMVGPGVNCMKGYYFQIDLLCKDECGDIDEQRSTFKAFHGFISRSLCASSNRKRKIAPIE